MKELKTMYGDLEVLEREEGSLDPKERLKAACEPLLSWFQAASRDLPWRRSPTPYHVWISEIMLQQTRVSAVIGYYERFLDALPDVKALAQAPDEKLFKLWEGLGYYSRARNLKKAAGEVMERFGGELPASYEELLSLPGIGSYTAGAIGSIAYGLPVPAVDGNVLRVVSRLLESREDILKPAVKKQMEALIGSVLPEGRAGAFNQALMELGALVCVPNGEPRCMECPLRGLCLARRRGTAGELPVKTPKKARVVEERTVLVIQRGGEVLLRKRPEQGLLAGLYEFPNASRWLSEKEALEYLGVREEDVLLVEAMPEAKHIFSHVEWRMKGYRIRLPEGCPGPEEGQFVTLGEAEGRYALPGAFKAYADILFGR